MENENFNIKESFKTQNIETKAVCRTEKKSLLKYYKGIPFVVQELSKSWGAVVPCEVLITEKILNTNKHLFTTFNYDGNIEYIKKIKQKIKYDCKDNKSKVLLKKNIIAVTKQTKELQQREKEDIQRARKILLDNNIDKYYLVNDQEGFLYDLYLKDIEECVFTPKLRDIYSCFSDEDLLIEIHSLFKPFNINKSKKIALDILKELNSEVKKESKEVVANV